MAVLRESPWYQEILAEGFQQGFQQGLQQGFQQGARQCLIRILRRRFGEIPQELEARLEGKSVEELENLMDSALAELTGGIAVNSLEEFVSIMST